ncbi:MAG: hypothetical protein IH830_05975 [Planctomycetes bacterium]|nr:hypothetical protein [Planctomycetota bacterium]
MIHHGGHHPHHVLHHAGLFFSGFWPSWRWYPSYGRYAGPVYSTTIYQQPNPQSGPGEGEPLWLEDDEAERYSIPDGVFMSAPLVETDEAPEALPRVDDDDQSGTSDERPLNPHVHEVPDR